MISLNQLSLRRGTKLLLDKTSLVIHKGYHVGVTGANGTGKSSLFSLVLGKLEPDSGELTLPTGLSIAHVAQETPATDFTALDYVLMGDTELVKLRQQIRDAEQHGNASTVALLYQQLENIDGYTADSRAAQLLHGLGFNNAQLSQPTRAFSGGWRMRLNLAQALMCRSDILLLDEPTNHLDLDAVMWLETWLKQYPGTLLLISHDRDFLDSLCSHIAHIEQQQITLYTGNYSAFEQTRATRLAQQQSAHEKQQKEIAHIQNFVRRFGAKATKAKQGQSRLKALARMELIAAAHVDSPFHFAFREPIKLPQPLLRLDQVCVGYANQPALINTLNLTIQPGDHLGLLGANGAGKSTLIKTIAGDLAAISGNIIRAQDLKIGYFAQHQLEQLRADQTPLWHLQQIDSQAREQDLRNFLGGFDFIGDKVSEPIAPLSGGEKARLALALLVYQRPNLLLLDEPTNHLDLEMRHALNVALQEFEGAMLIVSHDRHLLRTLTDSFILVADGRAQAFEGDLDDYHKLLQSQNRQANTDSTSPAAGSNSAAARKEQKRQDAEQRQKQKPLRDKLRAIEQKLSKLQQKKLELEQQLAQPEIYDSANKNRLKTTLAEQNQLLQEVSELENQWLEISEALE
ncbi:MAG: ATP-binding cassette domain-containing protein [Gammaproteobacteria bacterium]|nr:ATP-binding cassette domain-containing protein [Gammaproteobacteria bacterium]